MITCRNYHTYYKYYAACLSVKEVRETKKMGAHDDLKSTAI